MMSRVYLLIFLICFSCFSYGEQIFIGADFSLSEAGNEIKCKGEEGSNYYECILYDNKIDQKILKINNEYCIYAEILIEESNILKIGCSVPRYISNYYSYKKENNDWYLFKYEFIQGPKDPNDIGDEFIVKSHYLKSLKRNLLSDFINEPISLGLIKSKAYLYSNEKIKLKSYLVKGDRVLILDRKTDPEGKLWFRIYYQGKKDIDTWVKEEKIINIEELW